MMNTDESTQASLRLMDKIRASRLFTMPTSLGEMKLTQRDTNLCVPIAGSRLIRIVRFDAILLKHKIKPLKSVLHNCEYHLNHFKLCFYCYPPIYHQTRQAKTVGGHLR